jgi:recombination protein RecA
MKDEELLKFCSDYIYWSPIKSIISLGKKEVYDLSVPNNENFVLNGVILQNCAPPFREVEVDIIFGKGIDAIGDLINLALQFGLIQRQGAWYTYETDRYQGKDKLVEALQSVPVAIENLKVRVKELIENKGITINLEEVDENPN